MTMISIPKKIMQTWKNREIPEKWLPSHHSIKRLMPDWEYFLMTDEDNLNFCRKYFPGFLPYFQALEFPIMRADAIRYMWLYINGGIYLDLDDELLEPLDQLFENNDCPAYFVRSGNSDSYYTNSFLASKPGCPIFLECLEAIKQPARWWMVTRHLKVMYTTGPAMLDRVLQKTRIPFCTLPTVLINPCSICDEVCQVPDALIRPLPGKSWCGWDTLIGGYVMCNWRKVLFWIGVLIIILIVILIIRKRKTK